jgi:hypothetical protein
MLKTSSLINLYFEPLIVGCIFYKFLELFHSLNGAFFIEMALFPSLNIIKNANCPV